ncbi:MAG: hypothetical protein AAF291_04180 [Pseudomonadota bacterium]
MTKDLSPGEARTRQRNRREIITYAFAGVIGMVLGAVTVLADKGSGDLFFGQWETMVFDPTIAVILAVTIVLGFIALPFWSFTVIDELVRERNLIGYTGGGMIVMGGAPAWAVLHSGGLVPAPSVAGVWALGFFSTMIVFAIAWIRSR